MAVRSYIDQIDKNLLNILQSSFPMVQNPYAHIASELGIDEEETLQRIYALKKRNVVRQIGAIFDTRKLGYQTTLVAFRYPSGKIDKAARTEQNEKITEPKEKFSELNWLKRMNQE